MRKITVFVCLFCICVIFINAQELERGVRDAVNRLADRLNTQLDVTIGSMTLDGTTDTVSAFSRLLYTLVYNYADNVPLFRIVNVTRGPRRPDEQQRGIIKGTFAKRGDTVEVFLYLVSDPDSVSLGSSPPFTFPLAELTQREIFLEPENITVVQEQKQIFAELSAVSESPATPPAATPPPNQNINIQAFFNSPSMTYFHRDELQITVMADRDCYFKIIHIDANNQMEMIYPNSFDRNNYLRANAPREIFEMAKCYLYEPYGAEVILIVASSQQFANIEREYLTPWVLPATADNIRNAVNTGRGTGLESAVTPINFSSEGEARYTITILKPHEEYSYRRPENMREFVQSTRNEVLQQGGTFDAGSSETSGFYTINGVRCSYRVSRDAPDTIRFAIYNLDNYTNGSRAGTSARGAGFNFFQFVE